MFHPEVTVQLLARWDATEAFRPSFYEDLGEDGGLIARDLRDLRGRKNRGDPHRRYTFEDLLWLRIFVRVRARLKGRCVPNATTRASSAIAEIKREAGSRRPDALRLLFLDADAYLELEDGRVICVTRPGQLLLEHVSIGAVAEDIHSRLAVLRGLRRLARAVPRTNPSRAASG